MSERDTLFSGAGDNISGFRFDNKVVSVFPDMIQRSVPGYQTIIAMTQTLAGRYVQAQSNCYDLGCSLGASTIAMRHGIEAEGCNIFAVDSSEAMIERCTKIIAEDELGVSNQPRVSLICGDALDTEITNATMVVMNFTLQFIDLNHRKELIQNIYQGLKPGGILILSEKIAFADNHLNDLMIDLHHAFKRANDYSDLEISQKRTALENVLQPETLGTHKQRLHEIGFDNIDVWFQCFNFVSLLAIK